MADGAGTVPPFSEIFATHRKLVWSVACFHVAARQDREDLFQEIWEAIFHSLHQFAGRSRLSTWIYSVARHTAQRYVTRHRPRGQPPRPEGGAPSPEEVVLSREALAHAMASLTEPEVEIIFFRYVGGHSYDELAEILNIPLSTVKARLFEARRKIRDTRS
ncbi:MAG: sigma-70 family RNA polymerase sigma factor [Candidatus Riflebacteria bacterium]|nr:sigma-70 family RNA polymerase sigma factor [Candidatus Riflebacteria bacterium]